MSADEHLRVVVDQFSRQPVPFSRMPARSRDETNRLLIKAFGVRPGDAVLGAVSAPMLVACALAGRPTT